MTLSRTTPVPKVPCPACVCTLGAEHCPCPSRQTTESHDGAVVSSPRQHCFGTSAPATTTTNYSLWLGCSSSRRESKDKVRLAWGGRRG